jgi:hypothetical protein
MAKKRLSLEQVNQMKEMVQSCVTPEDIAKYFNIAISSVHNYKNRFKTEGMYFPSVKGKRPNGIVQIRTNKVDNRHKIDSISTVLEGYKFLLNGTAVQISEQAKNININKESMEIQF